VPIEIVNPDQLICTISEKRRLIMELEADDRIVHDGDWGYPIDALYSPVKLARYVVGGHAGRADDGF
jgi:DNA-directed RNA polymerase alpha subunit